MTVLITGTSGGIGSAAARIFLERGFEVHGLDVREADEGVIRAAEESGAGYIHHIADVCDPSSFPELSGELGPEIIVNCAGVQTDTGIGTIAGASEATADGKDRPAEGACPDGGVPAKETAAKSGNVPEDETVTKAGNIPAERITEYAARDIDVNLKGTINITEKYAFNNENIKAVVNISSASAHTGSEFPVYAASKGGVIAYTKNIALRLAPKATANSLDPGGVVTELNSHVMDDEDMWNRIMELTPMKRWAEPEEIAEWIYFVAVVNRSMTGQNLLIDSGEAGRAEFVW